MERKHGTGWRAEARVTLGLAWPLALTNLSQHALAVTDAIILGWLSTEALAAATLGANLYWALMAPSLGTALAAGPILAQARGHGQRAGHGRGWVRQMRRGARSALVASLILLVPSLLILWHAGDLLRLLGQDPGLAAAAGTYVRAMMWGLIPFCGFIVLRGFLAAMERPGPALFVTGVAVVANAVFGWLLVFGVGGWHGFGILGAGLASTLANLLMLGGLLLVVARDRRLGRFRLLGRFWRNDPARLREVFRIGLPISGQMLLEIGVFSAAALAMGGFGAVAVAAHAIALQTAALTFMVPMGIGQAATTRVGLLAGAGDLAGARRAGWVAIGLGAGFMLATATLLILAGRTITGAFLNPAEPQAAAAATLGAVLLTIAGIFQLADGVQAVAAGALRGLKDTSVPMLFAALGYWGLGMPIGVGLAFWAGLGPAGLWVGLAAGLGIVAGLMLARWRRLSRESAAAIA
ncbi:MATE family efflux transporter [Paeniroseomonas aquatica]|uniref:Multidrug-efflux transporter n=1 Tax=Paeniroseomonas aquatica TaxID=373043 RepID=A0ABT8A7I8_9PROT|nr:MATE family efflux transporter [Paeniroseomonas aquatica]MDN3565707.1 MATE family efflux transporter [Paeniroseomonas aquatica]